MIFGFSTEQIDRFGLYLLVAGFLLGAVALAATTLSAYLLYRSAAAAQNEANRQIAVANEQAATAQRDAETEKLERLKLEEKVAPRRLTRGQLEAIAVALSGYQKQKVVVKSYSLDIEGGVLGKQIIEALQSAGITVQDGTASDMPLGGFSVGIHVFGASSKLVEAITVAIQTQTQLAVHSSPGSPTANLPGTSTGSFLYKDIGATVLVGVKPLAQF
jgi:hypothetical protein